MTELRLEFARKCLGSVVKRHAWEGCNLSAKEQWTNGDGCFAIHHMPQDDEVDLLNVPSQIRALGGILPEELLFLIFLVLKRKRESIMCN